MATANNSRSSCLSTAFGFLPAAILYLLSFHEVMTASAHVANDSDLIEFPMNLEYLATEFFLFGALGKGLDAINPALALGGPPPIGGRKANLAPPVAPIIEEFGYQQVGHLRAIINATGGIPRPLLDISSLIFSVFVDLAVGPLIPPFDVYANTINYLIGSYAVTYDGVAGLVGTVPNLTKPETQDLGTKLVGVKAGQNAVVRAFLYARANETVAPYGLTVRQITDGITALGNKLGRNGIKEEGLMVPRELGAENRTTSNVLSLDVNSLSYARSPREILRILYGTGNERLPGGFFPKGANGEIATTCVKS